MKNRANPENCRALNRKYIASEKGKEARKKAQNNYRERHREKLLAHNAVTYALKMGRIFKHPCLVCGVEKVEGHHPDYSRPLDVVWLCNPHHREVHEII